MSEVRALGAADIVAADAFLTRTLGGRHQARRDELIDVLAHPGFVAERDGALVGLVTFVDGDSRDEVEVLALSADPVGGGVGTRLIDAVADEARRRGRRALWLVTTNDNLRALRFYQRRGFAIRGVDPGAVDRARHLKATIPVVGADGIPCRDEIELVRLL